MTSATQFRAILLDTYRELNSKKLFWITLALSGLVVFGLAAIGVTDGKLTLLGWRTGAPIPPEFQAPEVFYPTAFVSVGHLWLAWIATILALISTAGMIPDFIASGAVELVLSKPIGRARLFLQKYAAGLLFTALQVSVFCALSYIVIGVRGGVWQSKLFIAVPIVVGVFSFLYCVCALVGILWRSTIAALLLTLLFWFSLFTVNTTEIAILNFKIMNDVQHERLTLVVDQLTKTATNKYEEGIRQSRRDAIKAAQDKGEPTDSLALPDDAIPAPDRNALEQAYSRLADARSKLDSVQSNRANLIFAHRIAKAVKFSLPKTQETAALLDRYLTRPPNYKDEDQEGNKFDLGDIFSDRVQKEAQRRLDAEIRSRGLGWVLGTSLVFEGLVLFLATWIFARRDF